MAAKNLIATAPWRDEWANITYDHPCRKLAFVRQYVHERRAITVESLNATYSREYWKDLAEALGIYGGVSIVLSLLTYALGWTAAKTFRWIREGFKGSSTPPG